MGWKGETSDKIRCGLMTWGFLLRSNVRHVSLKERIRMHVLVSDWRGSEPRKQFVENYVEPVPGKKSSCKKKYVKLFRALWMALKKGCD